MAPLIVIAIVISGLVVLFLRATIAVHKQIIRLALYCNIDPSSIDLIPREELVNKLRERLFNRNRIIFKAQQKLLNDLLLANAIPKAVWESCICSVARRPPKEEREENGVTIGCNFSVVKLSPKITRDGSPEQDEIIARWENLVAEQDELIDMILGFCSICGEKREFAELYHEQTPGSAR